MKRPLQKSLIQSIKSGRIKTVMSPIPASAKSILEFAEAIQTEPGKWQFVEDGIRVVKVAKTVTPRDNGGSTLYQIDF